MRIGLTQRVLYHKGRAYDSLEHGWYRFLKDHTLFFIPNRLDQDFEDLSYDLDCLIITGGDDSAIRRVTEFKIATAMMKEQKPIIGVCHGAFLLTDALGGSVGPCDGHMDIDHTVTYKDKQYIVNSHHSQNIKNLHSSARSLAVDSEGNCEAWVDNNIAGVVWHPERSEDMWLPEEIAKLIM